MRFVLAMVLLFASASTAAAIQDWITEVDHDVFTGRSSAVLVGKLPGNQTIRVRCTAGRLSAAFVFPSSWVPWVEGESAVMALRVDDNKPIRMQVLSYRHNGRFDGFRVRDNAAVAAFVRQLIPASQRVLVGIAAETLTETFHTGVRGSTAAATEFQKACGLG